MPSARTNRREFLGTAATASLLMGASASPGTAAGPKASKPALERPGIGAIGLRYQGSVITLKALPYGDLVAVSDVDRHVREQARASFPGRIRIFEDYQDLIRRDDVDIVLIGTPDHWHTKMVVDACRAGKDVYVEKPLTLTVDEGKILRDVVRETGRVVQVGTWQRSDVRFRQACEIARSGLLGKVKRAVVTIDPNPAGGPFTNTPAPKHINWDLWLGQAPKVPYCEERGHYTFRWWYDYSGGKMTDWGTHHVDIAQWGLGVDMTGPTYVDGKATLPTVPNGYDTPTWFEATMKYASGQELVIKCEGEIGVRFEGEKGTIFVTRGKIVGEPATLLSSDTLPRDQYGLYQQDLAFEPKVGKLESIENHMRNFFDCVETREKPISDVASQHRSVSTCHLGNISMRLGRPIEFDPLEEQVVGDSEANGMLRREQRAGFEIG